MDFLLVAIITASTVIGYSYGCAFNHKNRLAVDGQCCLGVSGEITPKEDHLKAAAKAMEQNVRVTCNPIRFYCNRAVERGAYGTCQEHNGDKTKIPKYINAILAWTNKHWIKKYAKELKQENHH